LPIVTGKQLAFGFSAMPRTLFVSLRLFALAVPLGLPACADTLRSDETTSNATLRRQYDKTLTKSEREAAISDLQGATAKAKSENTPE
jgi:hypothetical protein